VQTFLATCIVAGTPLLFAIIGEIMTERSGSLNLGVEGMMLLGAVAGFVTAMSTKNPGLALLGAALAGAGGALIYAILTVTFRANQTVTGLTLTIFGTGVTSFIGQPLLGSTIPSEVSAFFAKRALPCCPTFRLSAASCSARMCLCTSVMRSASFPPCTCTGQGRD
jgi:ABC-type uncharacterized transport system permease subunit